MHYSSTVKNLKDRAIKGLLWNSLQRFGTMFISFGANIILARLLMPEDFGIVGMIMVFISISSVLIEGGFASALIQKTDPTKDDYSTVFYVNIVLSAFLYVILYVTSPAVEKYFQFFGLSNVLRISGFVLLINAFIVVQYNQLCKKLNFKMLATINLVSTTIGAIIGISLAYIGFGIWSLVIKMISISFFQMILFWIYNSWRPSFVFRFKSVYELFGFGSFILLSNMLDKVYINIQAVIIGKNFSAVELGFYTQAKKMEDVPVQGLSSVVNQVAFPVFSQIQNDLIRVKNGVSKSLKAITFLNFPLMIFLIIVARPLIILLLTEKWQDSILYFQILCVGGIIYTPNTMNNIIFKALGKSDMYFYIQLAKRVVGISMILFGLQYGLIGVLIGAALSFYTSYLISAFFSAKLSGYTIYQQLKDVSPSFFIAVFAGIVTYSVTSFIYLSNIFILGTQAGIYLTIYIVLASIFRLEGLSTYREILSESIRKKFNSRKY